MPTRILSVDNIKTIRMIVQRSFRAHDCAVVEAGNGEEGLAVAAREKPDLIILDITMPVLDGATMPGKRRKSAELKTIPVILLTPESGRENVALIAKMGVRDYLVKPSKAEQLLEKGGRGVNLQPKVYAVVDPAAVA